MAVTDELARMQSLFGQFQEHIGQLASRIPAGDENGTQLRALKQMLEGKYREFIAAFEAENRRLDEERAKVHAHMEAAAARVAAQKMEARPVAVERVSARAPAPLDPQLGVKLRAMILKELEEPARKSAIPQRAGAEVAEMQTNEFTTDAAAPPPARPEAPASPPPRQPRKPKVGGESFEWESTDEWEQKGM